MVIGLMVAVVGTFPGGFEVEKDGVRVRVDIQAHDYAIELTNLAAPRITRFEMGQWSGYNFEAPEGWQVESEGRTFRAWTEDRSSAIRRGQIARFALRVSSRGAVLGWVEAKVGFDSGDSAAIPRCWGPVPEPRSTIYLVPVVVLAIVALHSLLLARRDRKGAVAGASDP